MVSQSVNGNNNTSDSLQTGANGITKAGLLNQTLLDLIHSNPDISNVEVEYNPNFTRLPAVETLQIVMPHNRHIPPTKITSELSIQTKTLTLIMGRHRNDEIPPFTQYFGLHLQRLKLDITLYFTFGIFDSDDLAHELHRDGAVSLKTFLHQVQQGITAANAANIEINLTMKLIGNKRLSPAESEGILLHEELEGVVFDKTNQNHYRVILDMPTVQCNISF